MVTIQDRSLGVVKNFLMLCIFLYVFIYSMWYKGAHFQLSEVEGLARQQWQEPTLSWCNPSKVDCDANFSRIYDLPYCSKYYGRDPAEARVANCEYYDARELPITLPSGILIPTFIQTFRQHKKCTQNAETCRRKFTFVDKAGYEQIGDGESQPLSSAFVADVEDFTLTIDHSFRTTDGKVSYDDFLMQGRWSRCDKEEKNRADSDWILDTASRPPKKHECKTRPMKCVHAHCDEMKYNEEESWTEFLTGGAARRTTPSFVQDSPSTPGRAYGRPKRHSKAHAKTRGGSLASQVSLKADDLESDMRRSEGPTNLEKAAAEANKGGPAVVSMKSGDVLTLKTLLAMAGESLRDGWVDEDDGPQTVRSRGTAVVMHIDYDNADRWTLFRPRDPPWYTISVTTRPISEFKHSYISHEDDFSRDLTWAYGVYVVIKQTGHIRTFNMVNALMTLTSAMALLAISNLLTDMLALYVMPRKAQYKELMFIESDDMGGLTNRSDDDVPAADKDLVTAVDLDQEAGQGTGAKASSSGDGNAK
jgi:hypothetical protein